MLTKYKTEKSLSSNLSKSVNTAILKTETARFGNPVKEIDRRVQSFDADTDSLYGSSFTRCGRVKTIPIKNIRVNPYQPRRELDPAALQDLAVSIMEYGLMQPITVRQTGAFDYELIAGERRLTACKNLGMTYIPAAVMQVNDTDSAVLALVENIQRENLNYIEEAEAYSKLINEHGLTQEELADKLGKCQSTIANKIRILKLSPQIREILTQNNLTERHARALLRLSEEKQRLRVANLIARRGLNVAKTEELVDRLLQAPARPDANPKNIRIFKDLRIFTNTIKQAVDMMKRSGIDATAKKKETDNKIEYVIVIPKNSVEDNESHL